MSIRKSWRSFCMLPPCLARAARLGRSARSAHLAHLVHQARLARLARLFDPLLDRLARTARRARPWPPDQSSAPGSPSPPGPPIRPACPTRAARRVHAANPAGETCLHQVRSRINIRFWRGHVSNKFTKLDASEELLDNRTNDASCFGTRPAAFCKWPSCFHDHRLASRATRCILLVACMPLHTCSAV